MINQNQYILDSVNAFKKCFNKEFTFLPTAIESEIENFENKFKIKLPQDYKWFLLNVGNGIANKNDWGLDFIEKVDFKNYFYQENEFNPSIPFELTTKVKFSEPDEDDSYPYEIIYDTKYEIFDKGYLNGEITLAGYGCGTVAFLVVNGEEYGNVWIDDFSSNNEVYPEYDFKKNRKRLNFNDWISKEIDRKIQQSIGHFEYHKKNNVEIYQETKTTDFSSLHNSDNNKKTYLIFSFLKKLFK